MFTVNMEPYKLSFEFYVERSITRCEIGGVTRSRGRSDPARMTEVIRKDSSVKW